MAKVAQPLDSEFLAHQRSLLLREQQTQRAIVNGFTAEMNNLVRSREAGGPVEEGFGTGVTTSVELQRARGGHTEAVRRLGEIDAALERQARGTYGICELCGALIGRERLEAIPTASRCIECQSGRSADRRRGPR